MCPSCNSLKCDGKFWLESPACLFSNMQIIPNKDMTLEDRMNTLTRCILIVTLILYLAGARKLSLYFLLIAISVVVIFYYANDSKSRTLVGASQNKIREEPESTGHINFDPKIRVPNPRNVPSDFEVMAGRRESKYTVLYGEVTPMTSTSSDEDNTYVTESSEMQESETVASYLHKGNVGEKAYNMFISKIKKDSDRLNESRQEDYSSDLRSIFGN